MHRLDQLVASLPYEQFVLTWPIIEINLWGVITIDSQGKDYFLAETIESMQPHESFEEMFNGTRLMGFCYPACKAVAHGFHAMVVSVTESSEIYEVKYLPQGWPDVADA